MLNGKHHYPTLYGGLWTAFSVVAIVLFIIIQAIVVATLPHPHQISKVLEPITDDFRSHSFMLTGSPIQSQTKTFNVAFGLSDRHDSPTVVEDIDYGMMVPFSMKREESGVFTYEMLDWEPCTQDYLDSNMFTAESRHAKSAELNIAKLKCLNLHGKPFEMYGDFNTPGS